MDRVDHLVRLLSWQANLSRLKVLQSAWEPGGAVKFLPEPLSMKTSRRPEDPSLPWEASAPLKPVHKGGSAVALHWHPHSVAEAFLNF